MEAGKGRLERERGEKSTKSNGFKEHDSNQFLILAGGGGEGGKEGG